MYLFYSVNFNYKNLPLFCASVLHMSLALDHVFFCIAVFFLKQNWFVWHSIRFQTFLNLYSRPRVLRILIIAFVWKVYWAQSMPISRCKILPSEVINPLLSHIKILGNWNKIKSTSLSCNQMITGTNLWRRVSLSVQNYAYSGQLSYQHYTAGYSNSLIEIYWLSLFFYQMHYHFLKENLRLTKLCHKSFKHYICKSSLGITTFAIIAQPRNKTRNLSTLRTCRINSISSSDINVHIPFTLDFSLS